MRDKVFYDHQPSMTHIERHDGFSDIWLRKDIKQEYIEEMSDETSLVWTADEVYGRLVDNIPTEEQIIENFDVWFIVLSKWEPKENPITLSTIVSEFSAYKNYTDKNILDLEDAVMELGELVGAING